MFYYLYSRNIEDLTNQVNNLEIKVNDTEMENEELRERLGMDPKEKLDIEDVRHKKKVKAEQAVALNRALTKEVKLGISLKSSSLPRMDNSSS